MRRFDGPPPSNRRERVTVRADQILQEAFVAIEQKRWQEVTPRLAQVLKAVPNHPVVLLLAAMVAVERGQGKKIPHNGTMKDAIDLAGEWIDRSLEAAGDVPWPAAHNFMALVLTRQGRFEEAAAAAGKAIALSNKPMPEAWNNLGNAYYGAGRYDDALAAYRAGGEIHKGMPSIRFNRSLVHLIRGDYLTGFELYESRWNITQWQRDHGRPFHQTHPQWWGGSLAGKTLLLHAEQGHGDTIQQLRYVPWVLSQGPQHLVLEVHAPLVALVHARLPDIDRCTVVELDDDLPRFDLWCPMMSLCGLHRTTLETIPPAPYLMAA